MEICVTGAAGFIGSNLVKALLEKKHAVVGLDNLSVGTLANVKHLRSDKRFSFYKRDLMKPSAAHLAKHSDIIIHLAAAKIPKDGTTKQTLLVNTETTKIMLEAARKHDAKFVVASTSDVYGKGTKVPFDENSDLVMGPPTVKRWSYAISKMFDEQLAFAYKDMYGLDVTILRYFNSYGPGGVMSWRSGPQTVFIDQCLRGEPMTIHGDGKQRRCFTYVDDIVNGTMLASFSKRANGEVFNIGNDKTEVTILQLAQLVRRLTRSKSEINFVSYQKAFGNYEDVKRRIPNLTKAKQILGYEPKVGLKEGLEKTIQWQKNLPIYRK